MAILRLDDSGDLRRQGGAVLADEVEQARADLAQDQTIDGPAIIEERETTIVIIGTLRANGSVVPPLIILALSMFPIRLFYH